MHSIKFMLIHIVNYTWAVMLHVKQGEAQSECDVIF
jgi:hypothetical protein